MTTEMKIRIGADVSGLANGLAEARMKLDAALGPEAMAMSSRLLGGVVALGAGFAGLGLASIKMAGDMEQSEMAFTTMLGSADAATALLDDLYEFAARTPFEFSGLQNSARQLLAFGFAAEDIIPLMTGIGNAVAGLGGGEAEINRVTRAIGQMQAKGKVSAEEMMQLAELGIPAWEILAEKIGVSIPEAMDLAQKGAIPAAAAIEGLIEGLNERFPEMMTKQSRTLLGFFSTIRDTGGMIFRELGEDITDALNLKPRLEAAGEWLGTFAEMVKGFGLRETLETMIPPNFRIGLIAIAGAIAGAVAPAFLRMAMTAGMALLKLMPYIAIGALVAGAAYTIWKAWDPIAGWFGALWDTICAAFQIGGAGINIVLKEIKLGLAQFLSYALGKVADFGAGLGGIVSKIPLLGGVGQALTDASKGLRNWVDGFQDAAAADLDAAKGGLFTAQQAWERSTHYMSVFGEQIVDSVKGTVGGGLDAAKEMLAGLKDPADSAGAAIADGLQPAADSVDGLNAGLSGLNSKLSGLGKGVTAPEAAAAIALPPDSVGDMYGRILDRARSALGLDDPTKYSSWVAEQSGGMLGEGAWAIGDQVLLDMITRGQIPGLASGGIVTAPTLAMLGERNRPEAVIPLDRLGGAAGGDMTVVFEMDGREVARAVLPYMPGEMRRVGVKPA